MFTNHRDIASMIFGGSLDPLQRAINGGKNSSLSFASSIQDQSGKAVTAPWKQMFMIAARGWIAYARTCELEIAWP